MSIAIAQPTEGVLIVLGAVANVSIPTGCTLTIPTQGTIPVIGSVIMGTLSGGVYNQGL